MAVRRGVVLVIVLILAAVAVSVAGLVVTALLVGREPRIERNSTLVLRVSGDLQEMEPGGVIGQFFEGQPTVRSLVDALRKAKVDDRITSVVIRPTGTAALWGKVEEVRDAILDFKTSRKPIIAYMEFGGEQEYYPRHRLRQSLPHAGVVARSDRVGELRALSARDARQGRRVS